MMMCPGQDTRFWTPDDIFEVPCQACETPVEFFKTDVFRRCSKCGKRVQNPKVSLGCAQWCAYAKECLGFDPKEVQLADSEEVSLIDRLADAMKAEFDRLLPTMNKGGFIPSVDHQTPPGVSFEQYKEYLQLLDEYTLLAAK